MGFGCPICSEQLHRLPAEATQRNTSNQPVNEGDVNISAAPCGHLFHTYCINKWLSGNMASSKQCPCCRKNIPGCRVLPLYPNGFDDSILDDPSQGSEGSGSCDHSHFNITIGSLRKQLDVLEKKVSDSDLMLKIQIDIAEDNKRKYENEKVKSNHMTFQWKQYESYKDYSEQKERECERLSADLKKYQIIDSIVKGSKDAVEDELHSFPPTQDSIHTLLEMLEALKRELVGVSKKKNDAKRDQEAGVKDRLKMSLELQKLKKDYNELRRVYDGSFNSSASRPGSQGPVYNVMHANRTPLLMASKVSRKLVMNHEDDPIDEDVSLIQPFVFKTKTKGSKKPSATVTSSSQEVSSKSSKAVDQPETDRPPIHRKITSNRELVQPVEHRQEVGTEQVSRKRKSEDGGERKVKKVQKPLGLGEHQPSSSKTNILRLAMPSTSLPTVNKISKLTKSNLSLKTLNRTINVSSSDDDEDFSPMQLKGSIPGVPITPLYRPNMKSAAGKALMNGRIKKK